MVPDYKIEKGLRAHGLSYCDKSKKFVIASSYKDKIIVFNKNFKKLKEIELTKEPYFKKRGTKFNLPMDVRSPTYTEASDAAQKNMIHMWDFDFWKSYLILLK